ncbi:MAG: FecCD family ABC transporter permease, partial [Eubacteriaceae bacterium]
MKNKLVPNEAINLEIKNQKSKLFIIIFTILIILGIGICANLGEAKVSLFEVVRIILGKIFIKPEMYSDIPRGIVAIIWDIRLPRILCSVFVGAGLSVSGAVFQSLLMNPLADPFTIGISTGAALGASIAIYITGILAIAYVPILPAAFTGALITLFLVTAIANRSKGLNSSNLIIAGIIVSSIMSAGISIIKNAAGEEVGAIIFWIMGSLAARSWEHVFVVVPLVLICCFICIYYANELNILCTGEENAQILGVNVKKVRWILIISASLLTATCVSVSGIIGFVGLVIPHLLRFGLTSNNKYLLPLSALSGGLLLMIADNFSRVFFTSEIPVGVLTT